MRRRSVPLPVYRFSLLGPYNGFSGLERARGWQLTHWAVLVGLLPPPASCSICGAQRARLQYHSEDYYEPLRPFPICARCHLALHRRFRAPDPWKRLTVQHSGVGTWFGSLELRPVNLAQSVRDQRGDEVTDVLATVLRQLPRHISPPPGRLLVASDFT